jgi:hypothetical protein
MLLLQLVEVLLAELCHLRRDDRAAVWLRAVVLEVFLMVILGHIKGRRGRKLSYDRTIPDLGRVQGRDLLLGSRLCSGER